MSRSIRTISPRHVVALGAALLATPLVAHASLFKGEALDAVANVISWVAIVLAPIIGIVVFWLLHILPEKIAEKKKHPQAAAIQTLCLLSLFFGGMLWPLAWLWAYTKPVAYKLAYGTDEVDHHPKPEAAKAAKAAAVKHADVAPAPTVVDATEPRLRSVSDAVAQMEAEREIERLRRELADVRRELAAKGKGA